VRWAGHTVCSGAMRNAYKILAAKPEQKRTGIEGRIILKWILKD
jgi:hypothetical protein